MHGKFKSRSNKYNESNVTQPGVRSVPLSSYERLIASAWRVGVEKDDRLISVLNIVAVAGTNFET
jgi:hypothetical protein